MRICIISLCLCICLSKPCFSEEKLKINTLMQFWYENDEAKTPKDTFRLRRAELKLSGEIRQDTSFTLMIDPAQVREDQKRKSPLQDFVITMKPYRFLSVNFGQYKVPFGMEGLESSSKLDFIERSALSRIFKWGDYRDIGFSINPEFKVGNVKILPQFGVFNGEGQNRLDGNEPVDIVGRVVVKPTETLHLGLAHYNGKKGVEEEERIHTGVEIKFAKDLFTIYGEYAKGKDGGKDKQTYYISLCYKFFNLFQAAARHDLYDPDMDKQDDEEYENTIGLNHFIEKHNAKIQLNYVDRGEKKGVLRLNLQVSY